MKHNPKKMVEDHNTCKKAFSAALDAAAKKLLAEGMEPKAVMPAYTMLIARLLGQSLADCPVDIRQRMKDRAMAEYHIGLSDPTNADVADILADHFGGPDGE